MQGSLFQRFTISPLPVPPAWYAIPLRLVLGYGSFAHGYAKLARGPGAHFGQPGYETDLLYVAGLMALCIAGAGPLSIDNWLYRRRKT